MHLGGLLYFQLPYYFLCGALDYIEHTLLFSPFNIHMCCLYSFLLLFPVSIFIVDIIADGQSSFT
jgi:hypothetical protein